MRSRGEEIISALTNMLHERSKQQHLIKEDGFDYHNTSPVKRVMRGINRKAGVGARWPVVGVEDLLLVKTYNQINLINLKGKKITKCLLSEPF